MIELICRNNNPQLGMVQVVLRFIGLNIFIKSNINAQAQTLVNQFKQRGAEVEWNKDYTWCRINMFTINSVIKLGEYECDSEEDTPEEIEKKLASFYKGKYKEAKFEVEQHGN